MLLCCTFFKLLLVYYRSIHLCSRGYIVFLCIRLFSQVISPSFSTSFELRFELYSRSLFACYTLVLCCISGRESEWLHFEPMGVKYCTQSLSHLRWVIYWSKTLLFVIGYSKVIGSMKTARSHGFKCIYITL